LPCHAANPQPSRRRTRQSPRCAQRAFEDRDRAEALEREWALAQQETDLEARLKPLQDFVASHPKSGLAADKAFFDSLYDDS
jgi:hypothetical protein